MEINDEEISIDRALLHRKGARKVSEVSEEVKVLLQQGRLETVNLTEWLAVDHLNLLKNVLDEFGLQKQRDEMLSRLVQIEDKVTKIIPAIADSWMNLQEQMPKTEQFDIVNSLSKHRSDSVRCWAAYMVGLDQLDLEQKLDRIKAFAADEHFGVREISWMAVRDSVASELRQSIRLLSSWVHDKNMYIRRFAIEVIRPQGVWAKHIAELKENPDIARPLLDAVKSDPVKYVQDSVANWLNDASKTNPDWVIQICREWQSSSGTKETERIVKRAQRTLAKKNT
ncbi:DNA alkylation repair protein [Paenibacillus sp. NPDC058910]|uniref:DNA alkylation repair protein n=1 Tax=unclassified Paenibacillus TaxID=185978 RepID=UPI003685C72C